MRENTPRPSEIVGAAKIEKGRTRNKTGGTFSQITRSYFHVPYTYASPLLSESLAQAHYLLIYLCFFFLYLFSYNFSFLFLIAMECTPTPVWWWRNLVFSRARFSEKLQRKYTSKCYCKRQIDNNFRSVLLSDHRNDVKMFKTLHWNYSPADRVST